jgi:hypothetical protein
VATLGTAPTGIPDKFPGGGLVDCRTLNTLIASVASAAKRGDPSAIKQLSAFTAQATANGC